MAKTETPNHSPALDNGLDDHQPGAGQPGYATQQGNAGETRAEAIEETAAREELAGEWVVRHRRVTKSL